MEERYFALGPGRLYIAPASTTEAESRSMKWYAGATKGGVQITYSARMHEITAWDGAVIRTVRFGERLRVDGRILRLYPRVLAAATGSPMEGNTVYLGGRGPGGRCARVRVTLVCALPKSAGGGDVVFSFIASAASGASLSLTPERDSSWQFSLMGETDSAGFSGKAVFA